MNSSFLGCLTDILCLNNILGNCNLYYQTVTYNPVCCVCVIFHISLFWFNVQVLSSGGIVYHYLLSESSNSFHTEKSVRTVPADLGNENKRRRKESHRVQLTQLDCYMHTLLKCWLVLVEEKRKPGTTTWIVNFKR